MLCSVAMILFNSYLLDTIKFRGFRPFTKAVHSITDREQATASPQIIHMTLTSAMLTLPSRHTHFPPPSGDHHLHAAPRALHAPYYAAQQPDHRPALPTHHSAHRTPLHALPCMLQHVLHVAAATKYADARSSGAPFHAPHLMGSVAHEPKSFHLG